MLTRPHKVLDAAKLEEWAEEFHPYILREWEYSEVVEWLDFWDWLEYEHFEVMDEFENSFRKGKI